MFSPEMDVRQVGTDQWMLLHPLTWRGTDWCITVPQGFVTDFASIPRPFWALWPRSGRWNPAAVIHDYECRTKYRPSAEVHRRFGETLQALGVGWLTRTVLAVGVSQFGPTWPMYRQPSGAVSGPGWGDVVPAGYQQQPAVTPSEGRD